MIQQLVKLHFGRWVRVAVNVCFVGRARVPVGDELADVALASVPVADVAAQLRRRGVGGNLLPVGIRDEVVCRGVNVRGTRLGRRRLRLLGLKTGFDTILANRSGDTVRVDDKGVLGVDFGLQAQLGPGCERLWLASLEKRQGGVHKVGHGQE